MYRGSLTLIETYETFLLSLEVLQYVYYMVVFAVITNKKLLHGN